MADQATSPQLKRDPTTGEELPNAAVRILGVDPDVYEQTVGVAVGEPLPPDWVDGVSAQPVSHRPAGCGLHCQHHPSSLPAGYAPPVIGDIVYCALQHNQHRSRRDLKYVLTGSPLAGQSSCAKCLEKFDWIAVEHHCLGFSTELRVDGGKFKGYDFGDVIDLGLVDDEPLHKLARLVERNGLSRGFVDVSMQDLLSPFSSNLEGQQPVGQAKTVRDDADSHRGRELPIDGRAWIVLQAGS